MGKKQDEAVFYITARYVAEIRAGKRPDISDYLARYPQYADAIADFIAYYHAIEAYEPGQIACVPLSDVSRIALERALEAQQSVATNPITTLLIANKRRLSLSQLAEQLDLSADIVTLLERRALDPSTIPFELYRRLASILHQPVDTIRDYFALPAQADVAGRSGRRRLKVAEGRAHYPAQDRGPVQRQSFIQALEASSQLSVEQKAIWYSIISCEDV